MGEVYNVRALANEARREPFTFDMDGEQFEFPPIGGLQRKVLRRYVDFSREGDVDGALQLLLGEAWDRFDALPLTVDEMNGLFEAYNAHQGITPGESSASTNS